MAKRNYTREILDQVADGRFAVCSVGPMHFVDYAPRSRNDSKPWTDGKFRYSGRFVHTLGQCQGTVLVGSGRVARCADLEGHSYECTPEA